MRKRNTQETYYLSRIRVELKRQITIFVPQLLYQMLYIFRSYAHVYRLGEQLGFDARAAANEEDINICISSDGETLLGNVSISNLAASASIILTQHRHRISVPSHNRRPKSHCDAAVKHLHRHC